MSLPRNYSTWTLAQLKAAAIARVSKIPHASRKKNDIIKNLQANNVNQFTPKPRGRPPKKNSKNSSAGASGSTPPKGILAQFMDPNLNERIEFVPQIRRRGPTPPLNTPFRPMSLKPFNLNPATRPTTPGMPRSAKKPAPKSLLATYLALPEAKRIQLVRSTNRDNRNYMSTIATLMGLDKRSPRLNDYFALLPLRNFPNKAIQKYTLEALEADKNKTKLDAEGIRYLAQKRGVPVKGSNKRWIPPRQLMQRIINHDIASRRANIVEYGILTNGRSNVNVNRNIARAKNISGEFTATSDAADTSSIFKSLRNDLMDMVGLAYGKEDVTVKFIATDISVLKNLFVESKKITTRGGEYNAAKAFNWPAEPQETKSYLRLLLLQRLVGINDAFDIHLEHLGSEVKKLANAFSVGSRLLTNNEIFPGEMKESILSATIPPKKLVSIGEFILMAQTLQGQQKEIIVSEILGMPSWIWKGEPVSLWIKKLGIGKKIGEVKRSRQEPLPQRSPAPRRWDPNQMQLALRNPDVVEFKPWTVKKIKNMAKIGVRMNRSQRMVKLKTLENRLEERNSPTNRGLLPAVRMYMRQLDTHNNPQIGALWRAAGIRPSDSTRVKIAALKKYRNRHHSNKTGVEDPLLNLAIKYIKYLKNFH